MALTRNIPPAMLAALSSGFFHPVLLVYLDWPDGAVRVHTGIGTLSWDSQDWAGVNQIGGIEIPEELIDLVPAEAVLTLAGRIDDILAQMGVAIRGRRGDIYWGLTTAPGGTTLLSDPVILFSGYLDARHIDLRNVDARAEQAIVLTLASGPEARSGAAINHSEADQAAKFPGDTAGRHTIYAEANAANPPSW